MRKELEQKLLNDYRNLFYDKDDLEKSSMSFGFECGDGWYELVRCLCDKINNDCLENNEIYPQVVQVKEKFGGLRFYINSPQSKILEGVSGAIDLAERLSFTICETCGNKGMTYKDGGWFRTLCQSCHRKLDEDKQTST